MKLTAVLHRVPEAAFICFRFDFLHAKQTVDQSQSVGVISSPDGLTGESLPRKSSCRGPALFFSAGGGTSAPGGIFLPQA